MTQQPTTESRIIAAALNLEATRVSAAIQLLDDGNTLPFIARYRKEMTGSLDEDQLRQISEAVDRHRKLEKRRETILASIEEQGKLTPQLRERLLDAGTLTTLEDLYQPFKPKRRTRASMARDRGLQPLSDLILAQPRDPRQPEAVARQYVSDDVPSPGDALAGARDIVAETISDHPDVRGELRRKALHWGLLQSQRTKGADDPKGIFETYYEFEQRIDRVQPYQVLAINRGESEKVLRVQVDVAERDWQQAISAVFRVDNRSPFAEQLTLATADAASRLLVPAIERDIRRTLTEQAQNHAIEVFATNLRGLLNQPPLAGQTILGIDPGYRTGCKVAVIDATGKVLDTATIYPHEPQKRWSEAQHMLEQLIARYDVTLIAIGNGTASRETEQLAAEITRERQDLHYLIVNEAGASVYSASPLARAELPDMDVSLRGAVSIARRVQDPLAELVKIDPKSIGVGLYQHDVDQKQLSQALDGVVEIVVNRVGVDVNTASPALLTHVAGLGPKLAERVVIHRDQHGAFHNRESLRAVQGLGQKAFEQAAGFLRIRDGDNPLDTSAIHPESYPIAHTLLARAGLSHDETLDMRTESLQSLKLQTSRLAEELNVGLPTLKDIIEQLIRPGRDPREDLPAPILRSDVLKMEDLLPGMHLKGTVRNVVDFGAFIDIGVKQDGLLHRSKIPRHAQLSVGDVVDVEVLNVEIERGRIALGIVEQ